MMFKWSVMCLCLATVAVVRSAPTSPANNPEEHTVGRAFSGADLLSDAYGLYATCANMDVVKCMKINLLTTMDRVSRTNKDITVLDTVKLVAAESSEDKTPVPTKENIEENLPRALSAQDSALNAMLLKKFMSLVSKYSVQVRY